MAFSLHFTYHRRSLFNKAHLSLSPSFIPLRRCHTSTLKRKVGLLFLSTGQGNRLRRSYSVSLQRAAKSYFAFFGFRDLSIFHRDATYLPCFNPSLDFGATAGVASSNRQQADLKERGNPDAKH